MSIYVGTSAVEVRKRRLHSVISYSGTGKKLYDKAKAFAFSGGERSFSQCSACYEGVCVGAARPHRGHGGCVSRVDWVQQFDAHRTCAEH